MSSSDKRLRKEQFRTQETPPMLQLNSSSKVGLQAKGWGLIIKYQGTPRGYISPNQKQQGSGIKLLRLKELIEAGQVYAVCHHGLDPGGKPVNNTGFYLINLNMGHRLDNNIVLIL